MANHPIPLAEELAGSCVDAGGGAIGMPQLCGDWVPNQIFWLVVALVVTYLLLARVAMPRIAGILAERKGTITNDIAAAEELKQKARAAEDAYNQALTEARAEAARIVAATRAEIQADLDVATQKADAEIAARATESERRIAAIRAEALESVTAIARDTAAELVQALGGKADTGRIDAAVAARVKG